MAILTRKHSEFELAPYRCCQSNQMCISIGVIVINPNLNLDLWPFNPKITSFLGYPKIIPYTMLNTLGSFVFELYCGQKVRQTNKQTDRAIRRRGLLDFLQQFLTHKIHKQNQKALMEFKPPPKPFDIRRPTPPKHVIHIHPQLF